MKFKLSPRQRRGMFIATGDLKWLDVLPPKSLSFCLLMAKELPAGNENRDIAMEYAIHMLPIETFEGHTRWQFLEGLVFLFKLCKEEKIWEAIMRLSCSYKNAFFVYQETQREEALEILLSFCKTKKGRRWNRIKEIVSPEHWEYMENVQLI
ncbi:MAG: hypothetical protein HGA25_07565 [Clostridiales bacterium]|nr:hypothetical protein [Clostridiales bacterium]